MVLHYTIPDLDKIIYLDTDIIFVGKIEGFWDILQNIPDSTAFIVSKLINFDSQCFLYI